MPGITAVCPGSFDPITSGHLDIITRASALYEKVIVCVVCNPGKQWTFTPEERMDMIKTVTAHLKNVTVDVHTGLLVKFVEEKGARAIVRGLRALSDFEIEFQMALTNKKLYPEADTTFLTTSSENMYVSSSMVKQIARLNGDISDFVPKSIHSYLISKL